MRDAILGKGLKRVAVRSGNGVGKTALAARIMLWALRCFPESIVVTTAPTTRQVRELLWREARSAYHASVVPLGGVFYDGQPRWDLGPLRYAIGLSPEHTRPERLHEQCCAGEPARGRRRRGRRRGHRTRGGPVSANER